MAKVTYELTLSITVETEKDKDGKIPPIDFRRAIEDGELIIYPKAEEDFIIGCVEVKKKLVK